MNRFCRRSHQLWEDSASGWCGMLLQQWRGPGLAWRPCVLCLLYKNIDLLFPSRALFLLRLYIPVVQTSSYNINKSWGM